MIESFFTPTYDHETDALILRMTFVDDDEKLVYHRAIDTFIVGIKRDLNISLLSDVFDLLYFPAINNPDNGLLNWVRDGFNLVPHGSLRFIPNYGMLSPLNEVPHYGISNPLSLGRGDRGYLDTTWTPITDAIVCSSTDSSMGAYVTGMTFPNGPIGAIDTIGIMGIYDQFNGTKTQGIQFYTFDNTANISAASNTRGQQSVVPHPVF